MYREPWRGLRFCWCRLDIISRHNINQKVKLIVLCDRHSDVIPLQRSPVGADGLSKVKMTQKNQYNSRYGKKNFIHMNLYSI